MPRRRLIPILLIAVFLAFFLLPGFVGYLTDWWWFREIGYRIVFTRRLVTQLLLFVALGGITAGTLYLNLSWWPSATWSPARSCFDSGKPVPQVDITGGAPPPESAGLADARPVGGRSGRSGLGARELLAIYRTPFGIADPIFSRDIGFFVFTLPALSAVV